MVYYLLLILLFLIIGSDRFLINGNTLFEYGSRCEIPIFFITVFFLCCGYMTGSDWKNYEKLYYSASWDGFSDYTKEQLFYILMIIGKSVTSNFFIFLIACKTIIFIIFIRFFKEYSDNTFWSFFFFIPLFGLFLFIDNPLRYMLALGCLVASFKYLINKNLKKFLFLVLAGSLFHVTLLLFIPFYFIRRNTMPRVLLATLFLLWTFLFSTENLIHILAFAGKLFPMINLRFATYLGQAASIEKVYSLGLMMYIVFFFWILLNKKQIIAGMKHGELFFSMSVIFLFVMKFGVIFPTGFRFGYMFGPFFIVTLTYLFQQYSRNWKQVFSMGIALYVFLVTFKRIDSQFAYLPYSNYVCNLATNRLYDYNYRSTHNINYFIARKGYHPLEK